jgi:hypothetical protein
MANLLLNLWTILPHWLLPKTLIFAAPSKLTAVANGTDAVLFPCPGLPFTYIKSEQVGVMPMGGISQFIETTTSFSATFHSPGVYRFTRDADGYVPRVDMITVS